MISRIKTYKSRIISLVLLLSLSALAATSAFAAQAVDFTGTTVDWNDGNNYSLGWSFTANTDLYVNSLGVYAAPDFTTGERTFTQSHDVGIYNVAGQLVASTTVSNADALNGFFRYHTLATPVELTAGATYYIATAMGADQWTQNTTGFLVNSFITYNGSYYTTSDTLALPATADDPILIANGTFGPNMDVTPTPIPAAFWLLGSGLGMIGAVRRKIKG